MRAAAGTLTIVGLGPGAPEWITPEASAALAGATDIIGYGPYVARLALRPGQSAHASDNRVSPWEFEHCHFITQHLLPFDLVGEDIVDKIADILRVHHDLILRNLCGVIFPNDITHVVFYPQHSHRIALTIALPDGLRGDAMHIAHSGKDRVGIGHIQHRHRATMFQQRQIKAPIFTEAVEADTMRQ